MQNFCDDERENITSYQHFKSAYSFIKFLIMQLYNTGAYFLNREKWYNYMNIWKSSIKNYLRSWNSILTQFEVRELNNHEISWNRLFLISKIRNYVEASLSQRTSSREDPRCLPKALRTNEERGMGWHTKQCTHWHS